MPTIYVIDPSTSTARLGPKNGFKIVRSDWKTSVLSGTRTVFVGNMEDSFRFLNTVDGLAKDRNGNTKHVYNVSWKKDHSPELAPGDMVMLWNGETITRVFQ